MHAYTARKRSYLSLTRFRLCIQGLVWNKLDQAGGCTPFINNKKQFVSESNEVGQHDMNIHFPAY